MSRKEKPTFITEKEPFPHRLKELLEDSGTTQIELANYIGCTRQAISLYVTGQSTPDINVLSKISNYFNVSADYLLKRTDIKSSDVDIKRVCEITGLTEHSVNFFQHYEKEKQRLTTCCGVNDFVEWMIESPLFFDFLAETEWFFCAKKDLQSVKKNTVTKQRTRKNNPLYLGDFIINNEEKFSQTVRKEIESVTGSDFNIVLPDMYVEKVMLNRVTERFERVLIYMYYKWKTAHGGNDDGKHNKEE